MTDTGTRYKTNMSMLYKAFNTPFPEKPSKKILGETLMKLIDKVYDLGNPAVKNEHVQMLKKNGVSTQEDAWKYLIDGMTDTRWVMATEIMNHVDGVTVHVRDRDLVEALLRTDVEAVIADVKLPFPVMEICFPENIDIGNGLQVSSVLLADCMAANYTKFFVDTGVQCIAPEHPELLKKIVCVCRTKNTDGTCGDEVLINQLRLDNFVKNPDRSIGVNDMESFCIETHCKLVMALMLYLQGVDSRKALLPIAHERQMSHGMNPPVARSDKKRQHFVIIDLVKPSKSSHQYASTGLHHASPVIHWRKGHMRTLAHEKYSRNPDGSIKSVWIRPVKVMAKHDEPTRGERKVDKPAETFQEEPTECHHEIAVDSKAQP